MKRVDDFPLILRLLRRQFSVQHRLCLEGRLDEAAAFAERIGATRKRLEALGEPPEIGADAKLDQLYAECAALNERIEAYLRQEMRLLGREIVELQLDRSLDQLKRTDRERIKPDEGPKL